MEEMVFKICVMIILVGVMSTFLFLCWLLG